MNSLQNTPTEISLSAAQSLEVIVEMKEKRSPTVLQLQISISLILSIAMATRKMLCQDTSVIYH